MLLLRRPTAVVVVVVLQGLAFVYANTLVLSSWFKVTCVFCQAEQVVQVTMMLGFDFDVMMML
jgi:hypothetical protein